MQRKVLYSPSAIKAAIHIVIATVVFGMGCLDVHRILHWEPSADVEQFLHKTGHAERDGVPVTANLCVMTGNAILTDAEYEEIQKKKFAVCQLLLTSVKIK